MTRVPLGSIALSLCVAASALSLPINPVGAAEEARGSVPLRNAAKRYYGIPSDAVGKIMGGEIAAWDKNKWQVALLLAWVPDPAEAQFCGGSLVAPNWVVTAAHCVDGGTTKEQVNILSGTANLSSGGRRSAVEEIYVFDAYDPNTQDNDIALLKLRDNAVGEPIAPVTPAEEPSIVKQDEKAKVTGWGVTESGYPSPELRVVEVPLQSRERCNGPASYDGAITQSMLCAGSDQGGKDSCQGDSGGPNTREGKLIGVVSWGRGCALPYKYGVYSRVANFSQWIEQCMKDRTLCRSRP